MLLGTTLQSRWCPSNTLESGSGLGLVSKRLVGTQLGPAGGRDTGLSSCWPTTPRRNHQGLLQCGLGGRLGLDPWLTNHQWAKFPFTYLAGKEPELGQSDTGFIQSQYCLWNQRPPEGMDSPLCWSCQGERQRAGVGLLIASINNPTPASHLASQLSVGMISFNLVE